ncbi:MAG: glycosyltransferase family 4 protein [Bacteroidota bacterium]|nr:glycosyltransferase family 4 protein [Bacteroidota bacterium]
MHNITKIKIFRILLGITWLPSMIFLYPLAMLRKQSRTGLFFFFDRYSMGGAQRIHIDILKTIKDYQKSIYFTRFSSNGLFKREFYSLSNTCCHDVHFYCDNLPLRLFTVHYFSFYINSHKRGQVFGSNSTFFYDMLPYIKKQIVKTELLHNFTFGKKGMEFFGLMNYKYLDNRIIYDSFTEENIRNQYIEYNIESEWLTKVLIIEPGVNIPAEEEKTFQKPLKILCAGRGGSQKRIRLINEIAEYFISKKLPAEFHFAGNLIQELSLNVKHNSVIHGEISDPEKMGAIQQQSDIALLTSAYEGFPMFIKESMAHGCIPVVTALPGNLMHLKDRQNCLLINAIKNEREVVSLGIEKIMELINDVSLCRQLSTNAYTYAKDNFDRKSFTNQYRQLFVTSMRD